MTLKRFTGWVLLCMLTFIAFCLAGNVALSLSWINDSFLTGVTVFGVSFISLIGALFKIWYSFWG